MKTVFLCGGIGKRMFPMTENKFLLKFLGRPLLHHQIERAKQAGLEDFVFIGNPGNIDRVQEIATHTPDIKYSLAVQEQALGMANALESAAASLTGDIIVVSPNDVFDQSAYSIILGARKRSHAASYILGYKVKEYFPGGYLVVNSQGELSNIVEKPKPGTEPSDLINIVLHLHTDASTLLQYIRRATGDKDDRYEQALAGMLKDQLNIKVAVYDGFWGAIKYPWHIFNIVKYLLDSSPAYIAPSAKISDRAVIEGKVIIGENVRVLENASIKGPCYIGDNTVIGNNALVRDYSHIGSNCVVGFSTEVKHSYVGDDCWFHSDYIGDSVIGDRCSFGAGTILANFKFDESEVTVNINGARISTGTDKFGAIIGNDCKTGINSSIMPGIRLGPNSIVGSHTCLAKDLGPDKIARQEPRYQIIDNRIKLDAKKKAELMKRLNK